MRQIWRNTCTLAGISSSTAEILQRVSLPIESGNSLYTDSRRSSGPRLFMNKSGVSERALYV
ncbi:hypothetical protein K0T92_21170, partial [Paenibacillus oenotherae]